MFFFNGFERNFGYGKQTDQDTENHRRCDAGCVSGAKPKYDRRGAKVPTRYVSV